MVDVKAPLSGKVLSINVKVSDKVSKGQVLLIIEAMKMENDVISPTNGVVKNIKISVGSMVNSGDVLIELE